MGGGHVRLRGTTAVAGLVSPGLLADQTRLKIVYGPAHSELCVCDAAAIAEVTTAAASYHLRLLHKAGLVEYRRDGRLVYYRLADNSLRELVEAAHAFTSRG